MEVNPVKKKIAILIALAALVVGALKIKQSIAYKVNPSAVASITQSQDNRDPKDINTSAESRKRREPGQQQR